jgi:hypothetical protein
MENQNIDEQTELLRRNLEISEEILKKTEYIKGYVKWQKVWAIINFSLIVVPIIIGLVYLPPLLKGYFDQFTSLYK